MHVHAGAVVHEEGFGHHGHGLPVFPGHILGHILVHQHLIRHAGQGCKAHIHLGLPSRTDLMVVNLHPHTYLLQCPQHLGTDILEMVHRRHWEITLFVTGLVPQIGFVSVAGIPKAFFGVNVVVPVIVTLVEPNIVQNIKL